MTMMMLIDETVAVGLLSCYLEVKYSMSIFTSAMFLNPLRLVQRRLPGS